ncbi:OLC1v1037872C1 [Oldenlandia corymbosa var. corymbosa]|uniref:OLC1v1037872C1 n=1 Tax=Oldenlandia corymbosa var. corymbosa TaxID=529605 RepID=A0AAV1CZQ0_OLDCO|nr:OLC1v1037872C1 [Oldenlandia corymbosa var. corymbosa]
MTVLRSREIVPKVELQAQANNKDAVMLMEPQTPAKSLDGLNHLSTARTLTVSPESAAPEAVGSRSGSGSGSGNLLRRCSLRLASKMDSGLTGGVENVEESVRSSYRKRKISIAETNLGDRLNLGSSATLESRMNRNRKRKNGVETELSRSARKDQDHKENKILYLRSGKKVIKSEVNSSNVDASLGGDGIFDDKSVSGNESRIIADGSGENAVLMNDFKANAGAAENVCSSRGNDKVKVVEKDSLSSSIGNGKLNSAAREADRNTTVRVSGLDARNSKRKDKGEEKVVENGSQSSSRNAVDFKHLNDAENESSASGDLSPSAAAPSLSTEQMNVRERFRNIARKNASRFAHFSSENDVDNHGNDAPRRDILSSATSGEAEDWPGPFSTAMKISKDQRSISRGKKSVAPVTWVPKKATKGNFPKQSVPLLQDLCVAILVKHADAITSLNCVPDVMRHKLSHLLSDSRRMDSHFLRLLVDGSPTEIRVRDCSWLSEEIFKNAFEGCDLSNLTVLQLDLCGRCLADYVISESLACSANSLPALTTISFKAAYRLSDIGLSALVSSAPSLRSVDLSQCSLITSDGVCCMAASLGSALRELHLDECQGIDAMHILPALQNLQNLEVLSLSGLETVSDDFVLEFLRARGPSIKELVLSDCTRLTDSSVRAIAESCPELCAVDLSNLCKLTDAAIGYLANGCRAIQYLKLRRNYFSDEAVAAYLETCGNSLRELSLSNVEQVAECTATSLSRHSANLNYLDLSWCRNLTDEALGLIVDNCSSLKVLKVFGCSQITNVFLSGHSNEEVQIIGLKMEPILKHFQDPVISHGALRYSSV